jgi:hypothetical protein
MIGFKHLMLAVVLLDHSWAQVQVRDSAGVRIVESVEGLWGDGEGWTLSADPTLTIGVEEGPEEYSLYQVSRALRLPDGTFVIANSGSRELRYYDSTGAFLYSVGNDGYGPGEFKEIWAMWRFSDTLLIRDNRRASLFSAAGEYLGILTLDQQPGDFAPPQAEGVFSDGTILGSTGLYGRRARSGALRRNNTLYRRFSLEGSMLDSLGVFPTDETISQMLSRSTDPTTGATTSTTVAADAPFGRRASTLAFGGFLYHGSSDSYEIKVFARDGTLVRIIRRPVANQLVMERDKVRLRDHLIESGEPWPARLLINMEFPDTKPAYGNVTVDALGYIWVADYSLGKEDRSGNWTVFDPEGRMLGAVQIPNGGRFHDIGNDYVVGVWRTDLDVEQVRIYRLHRN